MGETTALREVTRRVELTCRLCALLARNYVDLPPELVAGQERQRTAVGWLLRTHPSTPATATDNDDDLWVRRRAAGGRAVAADAVDGLLADTLRMLEVALREDLDAETRAACLRLYAEILRQERQVRGWVRRADA